LCVVSKSIPKNQCGNNILEDKETYCNCPSDVAKTHPVYGCNGTRGMYLEQSCSKDKLCVYKNNIKVVKTPKTIDSFFGFIPRRSAVYF